MKHLFSFLLLAASFAASAQTKILDSRVDWDGSGATLLVYLSDDNVASLEVKVGSEAGAADLFSDEFLEGTDFAIENNVIQIPISGVTNSGDRFVWLNVIKANSSEEDMAYKAN